MYWFFTGNMPRWTIALHLARYVSWFGMCGGRFSILYYGTLIESKNLYIPCWMEMSECVDK